MGAHRLSILWVAVLALCVGGCGVKGPLTLPPKPSPDAADKGKATTSPGTTTTPDTRPPEPAL